MTEIIEKLKDNEAHVIFADMSEEEQKILKNLYSDKQVQFLNFCMVWENVVGLGIPCPTGIYRIKPDYEPDPEYVDLEIDEDIEINTGIRWLGVHKDENSEFLPYLFTHLNCLPSLPNFLEFNIEKKRNIFIGDVANEIRKGHKVFARLRRR